MVRRKVLIQLEDGPTGGETLWAEVARENVFRLLNAPFFAFGYAWGDLVECDMAADIPRVLGIVEDGDFGTARIYFARDLDDPSVRDVLSELASVGCTYELGAVGIAAVSIPTDMAVPPCTQMSNYLNGLDKAILAGSEVGKTPPAR